MSENPKLEPETYASQEIQKLRLLYHQALKFRLDTKRKMREIVTRWMNLRLSQYFMKWKISRKKYTLEEKVRLKHLLSIKKRRLSQIEAIRANRERVNRKKFSIATTVRNESQLNAMEKRMKDEDEKRVRTAHVCNVRNLMKNRFLMPRKVKEGRVYLSAGLHNRAKSLS